MRSQVRCPVRWQRHSKPHYQAHWAVSFRADPVLVRLFGAPASPTTKPERVANRRPLPNEVVWHVLAYWHSSRDA